MPIPPHEHKNVKNFHLTRRPSRLENVFTLTKESLNGAALESTGIIYWTKGMASTGSPNKVPPPESSLEGVARVGFVHVAPASARLPGCLRDDATAGVACTWRDTSAEVLPQPPP
jgi:hypothetical protein